MSCCCFFSLICSGVSAISSGLFDLGSQKVFGVVGEVCEGQSSVQGEAMVIVP